MFTAKVRAERREQRRKRMAETTGKTEQQIIEEERKNHQATAQELEFYEEKKENDIKIVLIHITNYCLCFAAVDAIMNYYLFFSFAYDDNCFQ